MKQRLQALKLSSAMINVALICTSAVIGYAISNVLFLILIRSGNQASGLPRSIISHLPAPLRWGYPTIGTTGTSDDIALLGDSYVEGAGDDYRNGTFRYAITHHLHQQSDLPLATFGTNGTSLTSQTQLYRRSLEGKFWPMINGRPQSAWPKRILAFIYEGNDFDNHIAEKETGGASAHLSALQSNRKFQPLRLFLTSKLRNSHDRSTTQAAPSSTSQQRRQEVCGINYCLRVRPMQAASPSLNKQEIADSIQEMVKDLERLKTDTNANLCVIYIPSPATIYSPDSINFQQDFLPGRPTQGTISGPDNWQRSASIRNQLITDLQGAGIPFIDSTLPLKQKAQHHYLHGTADQKHFNTEGNTLLASVVSKNISRCFP